jgi:hypothetical protein
LYGDPVAGDGRHPEHFRGVAIRTCLLALVAVALVRLGPTTVDLVHRARAAGPPAAAADADFTAWARARIAPDARYWIASTSVRGGDMAYQQLTFALLPRDPAARLADADAVLWYADARAPHALRGFRVERYGPGFGVAVRTRSS